MKISELIDALVKAMAALIGKLDEAIRILIS